MSKRTPSQLGKFKREKGVRWERESAKIFSNWLGCDCRRTPMSGAYGSGWNLGGDLMFDKDIPLYVELKNDESWRLEQLLLWKGPIPKWWEKAYNESCMWDKHPLLVLKRNHVEPIVIVEQSFMKANKKKSRITVHGYVHIDAPHEIWAILLEDFIRSTKAPIVTASSQSNKRIF